MSDQSRTYFNSCADSSEAPDLTAEEGGFVSLGTSANPQRFKFVYSSDQPDEGLATVVLMNTASTGMKCLTPRHDELFGAHLNSSFDDCDNSVLQSFQLVQLENSDSFVLRPLYFGEHACLQAAGGLAKVDQCPDNLQSVAWTIEDGLVVPKGSSAECLYN